MGICLYTPEQEENLFIRRQARTWHRSDLIAKGQLRAIDARTDPQVTDTHPFFRILFVIFTFICWGAVIGFFFWVMNPHGKVETAFPLLLFAFAAYGLAEWLVKANRWYRHGVEEALAAEAICLSCVAMALLLENHGYDQTIVLKVSILFAVLAFWLYLRFGHLYAALFGYLALCSLPFHLNLSAVYLRIDLLLILGASLLLSVMSAKHAGEAFRKEKNAIIQAVLFTGLYCTMNLRLPDMGKSFFEPLPLQPYAGFPPALYWLSYALTFFIPAVGLFYGLKERRRAFIIVGAIAAVVTFSTNKDYLGMRHYAWDPAILGVVLVISALALIRWLSGGEGKSRHGITAENLLTPENNGIDLAALAAAVVPSYTAAGQAPPQSPSPFEGGQSGGGGAERPY